MTREEAIDLLDNLIGFVEDNHDSDYDKALKMAIEALEQEPKIDNVLDMKLKLMGANINGYTQGLKDASNIEQDPKYCDRNMCIKNEYNGIGCDKCEVTKSQEPKTGQSPSITSR